MNISTKLAAKVIRKALKSRCRTFSVRMARGTAYGWIDIWGSGEFLEFTEEEKQVLDEFGMNYGGNCTVIGPDSTDFWVKRLCDRVPEAKALLIAELLEPLEDSMGIIISGLRLINNSMSERRTKTTSIKVDPALWKEVKLEALRREIYVSELVEQALRKEIGKNSWRKT